MILKNRATDIELDDKSNGIGIQEVFLFVLLISILPILLGNYFYGISDHFAELPEIFRQLNGAYLTRDFYVNTTTYFGPRFYYIKFMGLLGRYCPLPILFLLLMCLSQISTAFVTYLFSRDLFRGSNLTAMIACVLVMIVNSTRCHGLYLKPALLIFPLALISLWMGIKQKPFLCAGASMLASIIHPVAGIQSGAIGLTAAGISVFLGKKDKSSNINRKIFKLSAAAVLLGISALVVWIIPYKTIIAPGNSVAIYSHFRQPSSFLLSSFGIMNYIAALCFFLAFGISWKWWHDDPSGDKILSRHILILFIVVLGIWIGGLFFVEFFPSRFFVIAQTSRMLSILEWIGLIVVAGTIARILKRGGTFGQSYPAWLLLIGSGRMHPLFLLFGHIVELFRKRLNHFFPPRFLNFGLGITFLAASIGVMKFGSMRESITIVLFTAISFWFLFVPKRWYRNFIPILLLLCVIIFFFVNRYYQIPFFSCYFGKLKPVITLTDIKGPIEEISDYARRNIPKDAILLTPPQFGRFRLVARRAIVVDFLAFPLQEGAMVEWKKRILDCYGKVKSKDFLAGEEMDKQYKNITDKKIRYLAKKYEAAYAILYNTTPSDFPVLFQNDLYKIIKIVDKRRVSFTT